MPWFAILVLSAVGAIASGCGTRSEAKQADPATEVKRKEVVVPVEVVEPRRGDISSYFETTARVEAERRVSLAAEGTGRCVSLAVEEGDVVEEGQILAELKTDEALALLRQSEVNVQKTKTAYDLAQKQTQAGHGTQVDRDNTRFNYEQALAEREMREIALKNLTIRAPISGVVTAREIQVGTLVTSGMPAFEIVDPDSLIIAINPPEKELPRLKEGQIAEVRIDALAGRRFPAKIRRINPNVDASTGTVKVVLDFDEADRKLIPESAFARVNLVMDTRKNVLLLPKDAVLEEDGKSFVYVLRDAPVPETPDTSAESDEPHHIAERVEIGIGLEDSANLQVFKGLEDGDRVVINGQYSIKPGSPVRVMNLDSELEAKADLPAEVALAEAEAKREELKASGEGGQGGDSRRRW